MGLVYIQFGMLKTKWILLIKKTLKYSERCPKKRAKYLNELRAEVSKNGSDNIVYIDESGFEESYYKKYGWSKKGKKVYGDRSGKRGIRTNLIAAKRKQELLAPVLYETSTTAKWFNKWLKEQLLKELNPNSTLILDNARFHKKKEIREIAESSGHKVIFLPPYSPDFNPIEQDFAIMKKNRMHSKKETTIDEIVKNHGSFWKWLYLLDILSEIGAG